MSLTPRQSGTMTNNHCLPSLHICQHSSEIYIAVLAGSAAAAVSDAAVILSIGSIISALFSQ